MRILFSIFVLPVIWNYDPVFFKSRVGNETWLDKLTEVSNYGKFICNNLDWGTVKIGIIGTKVLFSVWI